MFVTEREILVRLVENFRLAAESCEDLAVLPARGPTYAKLIEQLKLAEGCCRQVAYYREDSRWFSMGLYMEEAHKRAGGWLRMHPRTVESNVAHPLFKLLAENLRAALKRAEELRDKATGVRGMILPEPQKVIRTEGRASQIILPDGWSEAA